MQYIFSGKTAELVRNAQPIRHPLEGPYEEGRLLDIIEEKKTTWLRAINQRWQVDGEEFVEFELFGSFWPKET